jgi:N-acetyl-gamma-glutamyl-phosphate reductase
MAIVPKLPAHIKVVDLSSDYRLKDPETYHAAYGKSHSDRPRLAAAVYGLSELNRNAIRESQLVANPGCFATAVVLALYPLVKAQLISGDIFVSAVTGSSGSGAKLSLGTHHPLRADAFFGYKVFCHQHVPEIEQCLKSAGGAWPGRMVLQAHSGPFVRGIHVTAFATLKRGAQAEAVDEAFRECLGAEPLVRLRQKPVDVKWVRGTPFTDIHWAVDHDRVIVLGALDNLLKGAASQAVQNMNLLCGLPETSGLINTIGGGL